MTPCRCLTLSPRQPEVSSHTAQNFLSLYRRIQSKELLERADGQTLFSTPHGPVSQLDEAIAGYNGGGVPPCVPYLRTDCICNRESCSTGKFSILNLGRSPRDSSSCSRSARAVSNAYLCPMLPISRMMYECTRLGARTQSTGSRFLLFGFALKKMIVGAPSDICSTF